MLISLKTRIALFFALALLGALAAGCSGNSSARSQTDRAKSLLNDRQYEPAIEILEEQHRANPSDRNTVVLLAQAHLGAAGVEMFDFVTEIFGDQPPGEEMDLYQQPQCDNAAIGHFQGYDFRCILMRILRRLPDPDNPHLESARELLRSSFANPGKTPTDVNFLSAFIELGSAMSRLKVLLKRSLVLELQREGSVRPADLPFELVIHHLKRFFTELSNGFVRAKFSYGKVNKFVVGYEGKPIIKVQGVTLVFSDDIGISTLARFAMEVLRNEWWAVDHDLNRALDQNLQNFGQGTLRVLHALDGVVFEYGSSERIRTMFSFESLLNRLLRKLADDPDQFARVDLFTIVMGTPPAILRDLGVAFKRSWDTEQADPLRDYFRASKQQWDELNGIMTDWDDWVAHRLTREQADALASYLHKLAKQYPDNFNLPVHLDPEKLGPWQENLMGLLGTELGKVFRGEISSIPPLAPETRDTGLWLMLRTKAWVDQNLWPVPAAALRTGRSARATR